jgi:hypothetical protein
MANMEPSAAQPGPEAPARVEAARIEAYVEIWAKAVDTQMHFNEMSAKSRQLGLTFVAAALGVGIVLLSRRDDFSLLVPIGKFAYSLHVSGLIILAAAVAVYGVSILDLKVYHRMLRGAVTFGEDFEENYLKQILDLDRGMTQAISHYSRFDDATVQRDGPKYKYLGTNRVTAEDKIRRFYRFVIAALVVAAVLIFLATLKRQPLSSNQAPPNGHAADTKK